MPNTNPKIVQLLLTHDDPAWQSVLLGLGDDGVTYACLTGKWEPYIPPLDPDSAPHPPQPTEVTNAKS